VVIFLSAKWQRIIILGNIRRASAKQSRQNRKGPILARQSCVEWSILYQRRVLDYTRHD